MRIIIINMKIATNIHKTIKMNSYSYYYENYKFIDAKIKNNFIQNVLECLFEPPIIYVVWADNADNTPGNSDIFLFIQ